MRYTIVFVLTIISSCQSTIIVKDFSKGIPKEFYNQHYIKSSLTNRESNKVEYQDSIGFEKMFFYCNRQNYMPDSEEKIGHGIIKATKTGIILLNKNCKIKPTFKKLNCFFTITRPIGRLYNLYCENMNKVKYYFWMIYK